MPFVPPWIGGQALAARADLNKGSSNLATTFDPAHKSAGVTLSNGNLTASTSTTGGSVFATSSRTAGKLYFETSGAATGANTYAKGLANNSFAVTDFVGNDAVGNSIGYANSGDVRISGISVVTTAVNNQSDIAIDLSLRLLWVRPSGAALWNGTAGADPSTGIGGIILPVPMQTGAIFPIASISIVANQITANFGASAFSDPLPTGFVAWG